MPKHDNPIQGSVLALARIGTKNEEDRQALEAAANSWLNQREQTKWPWGLQFFENFAYLNGNHLVRWYYDAENGFGFSGIAANSGQFETSVAKVADNRLIRPTESIVSMMTDMNPAPRVVPASDSPGDEDAAEIGQVLLDAFLENPVRLTRRLREIGYLCCICGTAAMEITFEDTGIPREIIVPEEVEDEEGNITLREGKPQIVDRRDIVTNVWTPYHLTPDPCATSADDMTWIMRSSFEDIDCIKREFGKDAEFANGKAFPENLEGMRQENATQFTLYWWSKFNDILTSPQYYQQGAGLAPTTQYTQGGHAPNQVLKTVIDVKPTPEHPRGRTLVLAGGKLVYAGDARAYYPDYPWRWHPYAFFHWFKLPGRFWGVPFLSEVVPLQKKINSIDLLVHQNRMLMAIGQWLVPKTAELSPGRMSGFPGEQFTYNDLGTGSKPELIRTPPLPSDLIIEKSELIQAIDLIAASGPVGGDVAPSAARAGVILDFLREDRLRSKKPMIQDFEEALEVVGQNVLIELQQNLDDPDLMERVARVASDKSMYSLQAFSQALIQDHHTVKIDVASGLMRSPEAMAAKAQEFYAASGGPQNLSPPQMEAIWKALGLDMFATDQQNDTVARVRRLISAIRNGLLNVSGPEGIQGLVIRGVDDPGAAAETLRAFISSPQYQDMMIDEEGAAGAAAIMQLFQVYSDLAAQQQQAMIEAQIQMQRAMAQGGDDDNE